MAQQQHSDEIDVGPYHSVLNPQHPLFQAITTKATVLTLASTHETVPRLYDVTSITESPELFQAVIRFLAQRYRRLAAHEAPTHILAIESSGYIVGAALAYELGLPFVLMRREKITEAEFVMNGDDAEPPSVPVSVRSNSITANARVVLVDDFISTGKTMAAAMDCLKVVNAKIVEVFAVCDMTHGGGVEYIHSMKSHAREHVFTLFRLRSSFDVLFDPKTKLRSAL